MLKLSLTNLVRLIFLSLHVTREVFVVAHDVLAPWIKTVADGKADCTLFFKRLDSSILAILVELLLALFWWVWNFNATRAAAG